MKIKTFILDSFTDEAFKGNPAAVCFLEQNLSSKKMLLIAQELNLSETAFVSKGAEDNFYNIRYFSVKMEIPLCGHATLAASSVVFEMTNEEEIHFITTQGLDLKIQKSGEQFIMEFPIYKTSPAIAPEDLLECLGIEKINNCVYNEETNIMLLDIPETETLEKLTPDYNGLLKTQLTINGVLITAKGDGKPYDFYSRYFWPWSGGNEDPVTGATHTFLAKYWADRLDKKILKSFQSSQRTGFMDLEIINDSSLLIKGQVVKVFEGVLYN